MDRLGEEVRPRADGGVACKGDLFRRGEDVDHDSAIGRRFVEEDCFSEVEFAGDILFLELREEGCEGEVDDAEGVEVKTCSGA